MIIIKKSLSCSILTIMHWPWLFYQEIWSVKFFVFHNMLYTQIKNKSVIIHRVSWNSINEFSIILITSSSMIDNCDLIEKGISRNWKIGTVKEIINSIFNRCTAATKQVNSQEKTMLKFAVTRVTESES